MNLFSFFFSHYSFFKFLQLILDKKIKTKTYYILVKVLFLEEIWYLHFSVSVSLCISNWDHMYPKTTWNRNNNIC